MAFYFTFPLLFSLVKDYPKRWLFFAYILSAILIPISLNLSGKDIGSTYMYYATPIYRLPEFVIGIALGFLFIGGVRVKLWQVCFLFLVFLFALNLPSNYSYMRYNSLFIPFVCALILFLASVEFDESVCKSKIFRLFIFFGKMSYSFYLMQIFVFMCVEHFYKLSGIFWIDFISLLIVTCILSSVCYLIAENHGSRIFSKLLK